ncbi:UDP-GlcNAc:undecaprenyl-phosphate GlcNAc-1-phosphate transferase [Singulisphaera sp. GP187]|uniref:MraY family glycosyltransferase n=1 Tax=Singulisphaera sp. GP187 TaxID=1882752 RepID=UPI00092C54D5|nr:MraY family glycosyltransferase [Singulisphaera sp. GP187]SIO65767.1 UDP-GlcNAc:undecaprenyl-phosphate GlcNAc-1-phosphate transferase [Singulisphaera sp. GP187]
MVSRDAWVVASAGLSLVLLAFALSAWFCALVRQWAPRLGLIDVPAGAGHKGHKMPTPLGGGLAIWLATVVVLALGALVAGFGRGALPVELAKHVGGVWERAGELGTIVGLATLVMFMGLVDDRITLGWRLRLGVQVGLATLLVWFGGVRVTLFGPLNSPVLGGAVSILWVVGLTNAFNLLDNMDGLAGGVGLIAALLFVGAQVAVGSLFAPAVLLVLVGALAGFLVHNRYPARLFMGDAGSNFLGFMLGALTIAGTYFRYDAKSSSFNVLAPLLVMAVPLYDTVSVIIIRLREGRSPFIGDRRHFSHRLVERGLTPPQAVRTIDLVTLAGGLGALLLHQLDAVGACVVLAQTCCLLGVVAILEVSATRSDRSESNHGQEKPAANRTSEPQVGSEGAGIHGG